MITGELSENQENAEQATTSNISHPATRNLSEQLLMRSAYEGDSNVRTVNTNSQQQTERQFGQPLQMNANIILPSSGNAQSDQENKDKQPKKGTKRKGSRKGEYICPECGQVFGYQQNLTQHMRKHRGEKLKCDICGKLFNFPQNLQQHKRVHSGERMHQCPYCPKRFNDGANFHRHKKVIHGVTRKNSSEAPKNISPDNQYPHMKKQDDDDNLVKIDQPFSCPQCGMAFIKEDSRDKHLVYCVKPDNDSDVDHKPDEAEIQIIEPETDAKSECSEHSVKRKCDEAFGNEAKRLHTNVPAAKGSSNLEVTEPYPVSLTNVLPVQTQFLMPSQAALSHLISPQSQDCQPASPPQRQSCRAATPYRQCPTPRPVNVPSPFNQQYPQAGTSTGLAEPLFTCSYCGTCSNNDAMFRQHLLTHKDLISRQYAPFMTQGKAAITVIINHIVMSSVSYESDKPGTSNQAQRNNTSSASPHSNFYGPYIQQHPAYLHSQLSPQSPTPSQFHNSTPHHSHAPHISPPSRHISPPMAHGHVKREMDDSGYGSEMSPWRQTGASPMVHQYRQGGHLQ